MKIKINEINKPDVIAFFSPSNVQFFFNNYDKNDE